MCDLVGDNFLIQVIEGPTDIAGNKLDLFKNNPIKSPQLQHKVFTRGCGGYSRGVRKKSEPLRGIPNGGTTDASMLKSEPDIGGGGHH